MKMRFLILGSNGMAGHMLYLYLKSKSYSVTGFAKSNPYQFDNIVIGNALDTVLIEKVIKNGSYDVVVNCIGILNDFAEKNKSIATFLNAYLPHFLAEITSDLQTRIIHISTDCVFSGKKGAYTETDLKDGATFYDRSKSLGELNDFKNLTLRNSIIGPDINPKGIGLFNWFMQQNQKINGFKKSIWTGQTTLQLAKTVEKAVEAVLSARKEFPTFSLADLYDPLTMPPVLVKAHQELDKAVDLCYRPQPFINAAKRIEFLFELYEKYTADLFTKEKPKKAKK
jgi:dTDP-4-dehydrorhamnose reductase